MFQQEVPVRLARMMLRLPAGWEYREFWANHPAVRPQADTANQFTLGWLREFEFGSPPWLWRHAVRDLRSRAAYIISVTPFVPTSAQHPQIRAKFA